MDPLSVTAGIVAVVGAASSVGRTLGKLASLRGAPNTIRALNNEIEDLRLILQEIDTLLRRDIDSSGPSLHQSLSGSLQRAKDKLLELEGVLEYQIMTVDGHGNVAVNRFGWARQQTTIQRIQGDLRSIRLDLVAALGLLNASTSYRIAMRLERIQFVINDTSRTQRQETSQSLAHHQRAIEGTLDQLLETHLGRHRILNEEPNNALLRPSNELGVTTSRMNEPLLSSLSAGGCSNSSIAQTIRFSTSYQEPCKSGCGCRCHHRQRWRSPSMLDQVLGTLFFGYIGLPIMSPRCDVHGCLQHRGLIVSFSYYFPTWFLMRILHIQIRHRQNLGPEQVLRVSRRSVLRDGRGSPFDISVDTNYSPLNYAIQRGHPEVCTILLHAGADPYEGSTSQSPYENAWVTILGSEFDTETLKKLQLLFSDTDTLDKFQLTLLHKIVLGILPLNLSLAIQGMTRLFINEGDSGGRTAVFWAAKRGDAEALKILLEKGADPQKATKNGYSPLHTAAHSGSYLCCKLLLDAHAEVDARTPHQNTALTMAAQVLDKPDIAKLLLDHGADINTQDHTGETAISYASYSGHLKFAAYLVEQSADLHIVETTGDTIVHRAVIRNDPTILRLLLQRGALYRSTSSEHGTILHTAALYSDIPTLEELTRAGLTGLDIEEKFQGSTALELAKRRVRVSAEWLPTFEALLRSVNCVDPAANLTTLDEEDSGRDENEGSQDNGGAQGTSGNQGDQDEEGSEVFVDTIEYHHG